MQPCAMNTSIVIFNGFYKLLYLLLLYYCIYSYHLKFIFIVIFFSLICLWQISFVEACYMCNSTSNATTHLNMKDSKQPGDQLYSFTY